MALTIILNGHKVTQEQLDAITPVVNANMQGKFGNYKQFEKAAMKACADAGHPIPEELGPHGKPTKGKSR